LGDENGYRNQVMVIIMKRGFEKPAVDELKVESKDRSMSNEMMMMNGFFIAVLDNDEWDGTRTRGGMRRGGNNVEEKSRTTTTRTGKAKSDVGWDQT
jgi:hypothetical protein